MTRAASLKQQPDGETFYANVDDATSPSAPPYTPRELLAIEYAERFALDHNNLDDDFWSRLRAAYGDDEILDLTVCIASFLALGRTVQVLDLAEGTPMVI